MLLMRSQETYRAVEREALLATLRRVGPDAPTLCEGWRARHIAGHLAVSEAAAGIPMVLANGVRRILPAAVTRRAIAAVQAPGDRLIERALRPGWERVLGRLAGGPPALYHYGTLAHLRLVEEWIHHEDIRRADGFPPRQSGPEVEDALWRGGLTIARYPEFLPGRDGLELVRPDGTATRIGETVRVTVRGRPGELLLYVAGRTRAADVTVVGDDAAVASLERALAV